MENVEDKISAVLNNPQLMQQIMSMAQSLGQSQSEKADLPKETPAAAFPSIDPSMLQKISGLMQQQGIDNDQQTLLHALTPYLSQDRVSRLERAMRAAKMAKLASAFLGNNYSQTFAGR